MLITFSIIVAAVVGFCAGALITQRQMNNFSATVTDIKDTVKDIYNAIPVDKRKPKDGAASK
ncbi:hypothetical protein A6V27_15910 [Hafnia alvei]|jgi:uncharacterized protein YneF (UPF0154 family)|uniref:hypothetical protein n=1 Tax=Hafnia alvei TaxID=569 RepID=UPI0007BC9C0B|nr:hypothetical protein [Hafnia alvei]ANC41747.1 hypothetical protein A6V27_15910 [Hafnia alvei]